MTRRFARVFIGLVSVLTYVAMVGPVAQGASGQSRDNSSGRVSSKFQDFGRSTVNAARLRGMIGRAIAPRVIRPAAKPTLIAPLSSEFREVWCPGAASPKVAQVPVTGFSGTVSNGGLTLTMDWQGPTGHELVHVTNLTTPFLAGRSYETGFFGSYGPNSDPCMAGSGIGALVIDQLNTAADGTITSVALQFPYVSLSSDGFSNATMAFNVTPTNAHQGYYAYDEFGGLAGFGNDQYLNFLGDLSTTRLNQPIVGMAKTPDGGGYWMVASDGGIFAFGDAGFYGSAGNLVLNQPIVGMATTPDGGGYWLVAADGGIFAYGDAGFHGSMGGKPLNKPIVGIAASQSGGYWLVASDGGIFAFGGAPFYGSTGNLTLNKPVVGMTTSPSGRGYWFVASDGGVFNYGDASFHGSTGNIALAEPIVGMAPTADGSGYWLVASDGGIFAFNAPFYGSLGGSGVSDVAGLAA
jgi:hypothetical protein